MTIRICDKCKKSKNEVGDFVTVETMWHGTNMMEIGFWLGRKEKVELCRNCIEELWEIKK